MKIIDQIKTHLFDTSEEARSMRLEAKESLSKVSTQLYLTAGVAAVAAIVSVVAIASFPFLGMLGVITSAFVAFINREVSVILSNISNSVNDTGDVEFENLDQDRISAKFILTAWTIGTWATHHLVVIDPVIQILESDIDPAAFQNLNGDAPLINLQNLDLAEI